MTPTPKVAFIAIAGSLAYVGLAILGWGSFAAFFSHPALIALVIVGFALTGVALFSGGNLNPGEREDRGNRWVLWLGVVLFAAGGGLRGRPGVVLGPRFRGRAAIQAPRTLGP